MGSQQGRLNICRLHWGGPASSRFLRRRRVKWGCPPQLKNVAAKGEATGGVSPPPIGWLLTLKICSFETKLTVSTPTNAHSTSTQIVLKPGVHSNWSVGHFNKTAFDSGSPKSGESQGLGESLRLSPILGESSKLSPEIGESFRGESFDMKELWHFFIHVQNSPLNQGRVLKLSPELEQSLECILKLSPKLRGESWTVLYFKGSFGIMSNAPDNSHIITLWNASLHLLMLVTTQMSVGIHNDKLI